MGVCFFFIWNYHVCIVARSGSNGAFKLKKKLAKYLILPISGLPLEIYVPSACTLCKSLVMSRQGSRNTRDVPVNCGLLL